MQLNPSEISELIKARIKNFEAGAESRNTGIIVSLQDGIVRIHGLSDGGGSHRAGPQVTALREQLHLCEHERVSELAAPERNQAGDHQAWNYAENGGERLLVVPLRIGR